MTENGIIQIVLYLFLVLIFVKPLGWYMAAIYEGTPPFGLGRWMGCLERRFYHYCGINPEVEMRWQSYLTAMLLFNLFGMLVVYGLQRLQIYFPFNAEAFTGVPPDLAFNTAISFATNTNWQAYAGEATMSYFTQMVALTGQNFLSAATGMSLLVAFIRGIVRQENSGLGNFWVDTTRGVLYILLPLAFILSLLLVSQGVIQNNDAYQKVTPLESKTMVEQIIPMGPVASQVAIKQLGSNGGGFFNVNSAHPYENPTPWSNLFEMIAILLLPASLCYMFGVMTKDKRQGVALLVAMVIIFIPCASITVMVEQQGNPAVSAMGVLPAGNMEGKETRFGIVSSALWAVSTTATANGSVNAMHDSLMPLGGLVATVMMHLGEVIFGGVGSGMYGMLLLVLITVFVTSLMVGRTPEYMGKKIEVHEIKMAAVAVLVMPLIVLIFTAISVVVPAGVAAIANPGVHGFTEILYAFTSMVANNGSAFAGLNANTPYYNVLGGFAMLVGRYWIAIPVLAIAGSLAKKKIVPVSVGTLATHTPLFVTLLICVIIIIGALSFFPALALGPLVEHLMLWGSYGH